MPAFAGENSQLFWLVDLRPLTSMKKAFFAIKSWFVSLIDWLLQPFLPGDLSHVVPGTRSTRPTTHDFTAGRQRRIAARQFSTRPEKIQAFFTKLTRERLRDGESLITVVEVCGFNDWLIKMLASSLWHKATSLTTAGDLSFSPKS